MNYKDTLIWKDICDTPDVLSSLMDVNASVMNELIAEIKKGTATNFIAAGRGASDHALVYFKYLLEIKSNYTVGISAPSVITLYKGKVNYSNSIVLACSQSGQAQDVLEVVKKANEQGAITIAVTNDKSSPLARNAKYHLFLNAGEKRAVPATKTFSAQLFILLWLASELSGDKEAMFTLRNLKEYLNGVLPEIDKQTTKYAEKFKDMSTCFVLARGLIYSVALETALIVQETSYIPVKGYSGGEFQHGHHAMVNENTPVIIFYAKNYDEEETQNLIRADQIQTIDKVLKQNAPVLLVTNDRVVSHTFKKCNEAFINFIVPEEFTMFAFTLFAQIFACKLSVNTGNDPDNPRGMSRVVITK